MDIKEIIECALDGQAILFLGSGFSVGAINFTKNGDFPIGSGLCEALIEDGKIDVEGEPEADKQDLQYISTRYLENNTKRDLLKVLKNCFNCKDVSEGHKVIASLPWKKIYTTNYDDVMELASKAVGINREGVHSKNKIGDIYSRKDAIIHINGFINGVNEDDLETTFKLTQNSYAKKTLSDSDWAVALHTDIKNAQAVVFIGYSLDCDLELKQIFACDEKLKDKCIFVDYNPSRRKITSMRAFGDIYPDGTDCFAKVIQDVKASYKPDEKEYKLKSLTIEKAPLKLAQKVDASDVIRLFVNGMVDDAIVYSALESEYIFKRDYTEQIYAFISGEGKVAIIHSDLSNGKSIIAKQLMVMLNQNGDVYSLNNNADTQLADDLEYLSNKKGMHYIFVRNYNQVIDGNTWNILCRYQFSNIKYIFTARSYINDNFYYRVSKDMHLSYDSLGMYDVNELKDADIDRFDKLISNYGLWGKNYTTNTRSRYGFIKKKCRSEVKSVLLELYKSPAVTQKIDLVIQNIIKDELAKKVLLCAFICNILTIPIEVDDLAIILGVDTVNKIFFDKYAELKELLLIEGNKIGLKSSSVATYVINANNYNDEVLEIANGIVNHFCNHSYNQQYAHILRFMISFSNLRLIFNRKDADLKTKYINFYENARKTGFYDDNQFFWIQFAIAVMEVEDYNAAEIYLNNASALSHKKINDDSYQVDSLRARLLLERTIVSGDKENAFKNFEQAHRLICSNKTPERHYPYRQVSHYVDFYETFYVCFSDKEKVSFMFMCTEMQKKIELYLNRVSDYEKNSRRINLFIKGISDNLQIIINKMAAEAK